jgi:hypothetical protein
MTAMLKVFVISDGIADIKTYMLSDGNKVYHEVTTERTSNAILVNVVPRRFQKSTRVNIHSY